MANEPCYAHSLTSSSSLWEESPKRTAHSNSCAKKLLKIAKQNNYCYRFCRFYRAHYRHQTSLRDEICKRKCNISKAPGPNSIERERRKMTAIVWKMTATWAGLSTSSMNRRLGQKLEMRRVHGARKWFVNKENSSCAYFIAQINKDNAYNNMKPHSKVLSQCKKGSYSRRYNQQRTLSPILPASFCPLPSFSLLSFLVISLLNFG